MNQTELRSATYADHSINPPQIERHGERTWITRGANMVVVVSEVQQGTTLAYVVPDESFVFLPACKARIEAGGEQLDAGRETLTIVPPGASAVTALEDGLIVRIFSSRADAFAAQASNNINYADGAPEVAPLVPWPDPPEGFRLRNYVLADYVKEGSNSRIFRSTNLMINVLGKRPVPRDVSKLSPHLHADFEQASLAVQGRYMHHLRYPWTPDMRQWRDDEHVEVGSPSVTVIPAGVLHTSRNVSEGDCWLIDIFAPPRFDFSSRPGMVCNADEYPMPAR